MELEAMRSGTKQKKEKEIAELYRRALEGATRLEADGKRIEAYRFYAGVAEDFRGLSDVSAAAEKAAALGRSTSISDFLKDARRRDDRDRFAIQTLTQKLRRALNSAELPLAGIVAADLGIAGLKKKAASADSPEERLSAERILANLRVQTSYYLPEQFVGENDYPRARLVLSLAAEIDPEDPRVDYNLASAAARTGHRQRALKDLQRAAEKGFRRFDLLDEDEDFASLRGDPEFQKWLARARATATPRP
jgi:tetratricopeptide (TPR) repeat protein